MIARNQNSKQEANRLHDRTWSGAMPSLSVVVGKPYETYSVETGTDNSQQPYFEAPIPLPPMLKP
jgi:hypothetical protein